jgi:hypothetical protein
MFRILIFRSFAVGNVEEANSQGRRGVLNVSIILGTPHSILLSEAMRTTSQIIPRDRLRWIG